jgi:hypothetical protein
MFANLGIALLILAAAAALLEYAHRRSESRVAPPA